MKRILCLGNPLIAQDNAGPLLFKHLSRESLPEDVELIDGGTRGLDLLPFFDGACLVILIDQVEGFDTRNGVVLLSGNTLIQAVEKRYDHQAGIAYLLQMLPQVCDAGQPEVCMIGIEGCLNERKTALCLKILRQQLAA